jgi:hypothetical protein
MWLMVRKSAGGKRPAAALIPAMNSRRLVLSLRMKIFLLCLALVTALAVIAVSYPGGGAHILQIKYLQPAWRTQSTDRPPWI